MIRKSKRTEAKLVSGIGFIKKLKLTSAYGVSNVADMTDIV